MALHPQINVAEWCAGVQGLGLALRIVFGERTRTCLIIEREAYPAALDVARMADSPLGEAAIFSDITAFDAKPWRGKIHLVACGFPCQPFSAAGKQLHTKDERWIWDDIARCLREIGFGQPDGPEFVYLENVTGLALSNDVDGRGGWRLPAGLWHVLRDLATMGAVATWGVFRASDVGASHRRARLFILAYAPRGDYQTGQRFRISTAPSEGFESWIAGCGDTVADAGDRLVPQSERGEEGRGRTGSANDAMGDSVGARHATSWKRSATKQRSRQPVSCAGGTELANAACNDERRDTDREHRTREQAGGRGGEMADAANERTRSVPDRQGWIEADHAGRAGDAVAYPDCGEFAGNGQTCRQGIGSGYVNESDNGLVNAECEGLQRHGGNGDHSDESRWLTEGQSGPVGQRGYDLFPPGPGLGGYGVIDAIIELYGRDPEAAWQRYQAELRNTLEWRRVLTERPDLAPAIEPTVQRVAPRLANELGKRESPTRTDELRAVGKGVTSLAAAFAFCVLAERLGIEVKIDGDAI